MEVLHELDHATIEGLRGRGEFFWLDLKNPSDADVREVGQLFRYHPAAIEDSLEFGQRPKLDPYDDQVLLVFFGTDGQDLVEVHVHISGEAVVTLRHGHCAMLHDARQRLQRISARSEEETVYRVLDALTDSFIPTMDAIEQQVDDLEDAIVRDAVPEQRSEILALRRRLAELRRVAVPQRDVMASGVSLIEDLPGLDGDRAHPWLRDVQDHLARTAERIDGQREALAQALDLHSAGIANRLSHASQRLSIVATIFLPLTFVTGFFGQNFGWLVGNVTSLWTFLVYGVGVMILSSLLIYGFVRRERLDRD